MPGRAITIELPDDLYERLDRRAREAQRSLAAEVVQLLTASAAPDDALPPELEQELAEMATFDDDRLLSAADTRLTPRQSRRLETLHFKLQDEGLTDRERAEEQRLMRIYERAMLVRAYALAELKQRGHDITPLVSR